MHSKFFPTCTVLRTPDRGVFGLRHERCRALYQDRLQGHLQPALRLQDFVAQRFLLRSRHTVYFGIGVVGQVVYLLGSCRQDDPNMILSGPQVPGTRCSFQSYDVFPAVMMLVLAVLDPEVSIMSLK